METLADMGNLKTNSANDLWNSTKVSNNQSLLARFIGAVAPRKPRIHWQFNQILIPPQLSSLSASVVVGVCVYATLWAVGTFGCVATLVRVWRLTRQRTATPLAGTFVYIGALCAVDLLTTTSILSLITDLLFNGAWLFADALCPVQMCVEWVGKTLNSYLLTALAFERCAAVRLPHRAALRRCRFASSVTVLLLSLGMLQLMPILMHSRVELAPVSEHTHEGDPAYNPQRRRIEANVSVGVQPLCGFNLDEQEWISLKGYMSWLVVTGFIFPVGISTTFHLLTLSALRGRWQRRAAFQTMVNRATRSSVLIVSFYLVCLTPHWVITMWALLRTEEGTPDIFLRMPFLQRIMMLLHELLPVLNSSLNWILYGAMNRQLGTGATVRATSISQAPMTTGAGWRSILPFSSVVRQTLSASSATVPRRCRSSAEGGVMATRVPLLPPIGVDAQSTVSDGLGKLMANKTISML